MTIGRPLVPILAMLALVGCSQQKAADTSAATDPASTTPILQPLDTTAIGTNDVSVGGYITKTPGQSGAPSFYLIAANNDGKSGCNATGVNNKATFTMTSSNTAVIPDSTGLYQSQGCNVANAVTIPYTVSSSAAAGTIVTLTVNATTPGSTNTPTRFDVKVIAAAPSDSTPPTITPTITGTEGDNGWYTSSVVVSWNVSDPQSAITTPECVPALVDTDTTAAGTTVSCTATSSGGSTTRLVTIKLDTTAPTVTPASITNTTWRNTPLGQVFTASDSASGLAADQGLNDDRQFTLTASAQSASAAQPTTVSKTIADNAGNSTTRTVSALIDTTRPTISAQTYGLKADGVTVTDDPISPNANGWFNRTVVVRFMCTDALSGVVASGPGACPADVTVDRDTLDAGEVVSGTVRDNAGNTSLTATETVRVDTAAPTISAAVSPDANSAGWHRSDATVTFTCSGLGTGGSCPAPVSVTQNTDADGTVVSATATDRAGNTASASATVKLDRSAPVASLAASGPLGLNGWYRGTVSFSTTGSTDALSGLASCTAVAPLATDDASHTVVTTCTDVAGNTDTATLSVKRDATPPTISAAPDRPANASDWYGADVTVAFTCADATSGVGTCPASEVVSDEGSMPVSATATDQAGNQATSSPLTIRLDRTAPTAQVAATTAPNALGWYRTDVTFTTSGTDGLSGVASCTTPATLNDDATGHVATGTCTDNAGNTSPVASSAPVNRDTVKPTLTLAAASAPNAAGWYRQDVAFTLTKSDDRSGIDEASCTGPAPITGEGTGLTTTASCYDRAGNSASLTSAGVNIDTTAPSAALTPSPAVPNGLNGWYRSGPVSFAVTGTDITPAGVTGVSGNVTCSAVGPIAGDTSGTTVSTTCTDAAGNSTPSAPLTIRLDSAAPTATISPSPAAPNGSNGWYRSGPVTFSTSGTDSLSGHVTCTAIPAISTDTPGSTFTTTCTDEAGNPMTASLAVKLDQTAPTLTVPGNITVNATSNSQAMVTFAAATASDNFTSPVSATCDRVSGTSYPVGTATVTCAATDQAGNTTTRSFTITVRYDFTGFFQPIDMGGVYNTVKVGSAVPVKFRLGGHQGLNVFAAGSPSATTIPCSPTASIDEVEEVATSSTSSLNYDATAGQYVYVWKTSTAFRAGSCYQLTVRFVDGSSQTALFKFR